MGHVIGMCCYVFSETAELFTTVAVLVLAHSQYQYMKILVLCPHQLLVNWALNFKTFLEV